MNQHELVRRADALKAELARAAAHSPDAASLQRSLQGVLQDVYAGKVTEELEWQDVPGGRLFTDGDLRSDRELESAYSYFKLYVTGLEPKR
jgi:hypothetical protein